MLSLNFIYGLHKNYSQFEQAFSHYIRCSMHCRRFLRQPPNCLLIVNLSLAALSVLENIYSIFFQQTSRKHLFYSSFYFCFNSFFFGALHGKLVLLLLVSTFYFCIKFLPVASFAFLASSLFCWCVLFIPTRSLLQAMAQASRYKKISFYRFIPGLAHTCIYGRAQEIRLLFSPHKLLLGAHLRNGTFRRLSTDILNNSDINSELGLFRSSARTYVFLFVLTVLVVQLRDLLRSEDKVFWV